MKNLGLKKTIQIFLVLIVFVFIAVNIGFNTVLKTLDNSSVALYEKNYLPLKVIGDYQKKSELIKYSLASFVADLTPGPATANLITSVKPELEKDYNVIVKSVNLDDEKVLKEFKKFKLGHFEFMKLLETCKKFSNAHEKDEIEDILDDAWVDVIVNVFKPIDKVHAQLSKNYGEQVKKNIDFTSFIEKITIGFAIFVVLVILIGMFFMMKRINITVGSLLNITAKVTNGTVEISMGNQDLSSRTQEQAANLEETASNLEVVAESVKQTSGHATQALDLSNDALRVSMEGNELSSATNTAMLEITKSSQQIADIVNLVEEIAFQTNILAINAAVEAAKAGEQGKGFAVVAIEVRDLASRSSDAAKDIKNLIDESMLKVNEGSKLVGENVTKLEEIKDRVGKVSTIMQDISGAMNSQEASVIEINNAVTELDNVTQQNSALVEEIASSSESMTKMAENLDRLVKSTLIGA